MSLSQEAARRMLSAQRRDSNPYLHRARGKMRAPSSHASTLLYVLQTLTACSIPLTAWVPAHGAGIAICNVMGIVHQVRASRRRYVCGSDSGLT